MTKEETWLKAWLSVASSVNTKFPDIADEWADHCLKEFTKRFNNYVPSTTDRGMAEKNTRDS